MKIKQYTKAIIFLNKDDYRKLQSMKKIQSIGVCLFKLLYVSGINHLETNMCPLAYANVELFSLGILKSCFMVLLSYYYLFSCAV